MKSLKERYSEKNIDLIEIIENAENYSEECFKVVKGLIIERKLNREELENLSLIKKLVLSLPKYR